MIFGIIAMLLVGISWIVWGYVAGVANRRKLNMELMVACSAALGAAVSLPIALGKGLPDFTSPQVLVIMGWIVLGGILNFAQLQFMNRAMNFGPNGIIWSIIQMGFICPFILGVSFFGEPLSWSFVAGVVLVIAALTIFAVAGDNTAKGKWMFFTLLSFLATCGCQSCQYIPSNLAGVDQVPSIWRTLGFFSGLLLGFVITICVSGNVRKQIVPQTRNKYTWIYSGLIVSVEVATCSLLLYPGLDAMAKAGIGAISTQLMTASSIVAFELYAILLLREKRTVMQVIATLLCLASIAAVCF